MKFKSSKSNTAIIVGLLLLTVIGIYFALDRPEQEPFGNVFVCGKQAVPFRANISDCMGVAVQPSETLLVDILTSPLADSAVILVDPTSSSDMGLASYDIYKVMDSIKSETGVVPSIAYTTYYEEQPEVPVLSIEQATFNLPVIWLQPNQSKTLIDVNGPQIIIYAQNAYGLDAAACRVSILLIEEVLEC